MTPTPLTAATRLEDFKTMLLATDFSQNAAAALDWALELAKSHQARVIIVHAMEPVTSAMGQSDEIAPTTEDLMTDALHRAADRGVSANGETHVDKAWNVVPAVAARIGADLIVLGAQGKTNFAGRLLGSTADRIIKTTSTPVIVIRDDARPPGAIYSILVAIDFSEESAQATHMALRLIRNSTSAVRIVLLHVIALSISYPDPSRPSAKAGVSVPEYWNEAERDARRRLESIAAPIRSLGLNVETKTVRGYPPQEILREAASIEAQLVAIGTQGRTGLRWFFMGSVAEWVLHHATCPVMTVRKSNQAQPTPSLS